MNFSYYLLLFGVIFILIELFGYYKYRVNYKGLEDSTNYFETNYCVFYTFLGFSIMIGMIITVIALSSYKTEIVSKYSDVTEVIYKNTVDGETKFAFRYPDKQEYKTLAVVYKDDIETPYVANIVQSDKAGLIKIEGIALVLDSSFENYGNEVIYSSNKKENSNRLVYNSN